MCGSICKILIGIILVMAGLWLILPVAWLTSIGVCFGFCPALWRALWLVILGIVPILLVILGVLLVWIEAEELKLEMPKKKRKR